MIQYVSIWRTVKNLIDPSIDTTWPVDYICIQIDCQHFRTYLNSYLQVNFELLLINLVLDWIYMCSHFINSEPWPWVMWWCSRLPLQLLRKINGYLASKATDCTHIREVPNWLILTRSQTDERIYSITCNVIRYLTHVGVAIDEQEYIAREMKGEDKYLKVSDGEGVWRSLASLQRTDLI